MAVYRAHEIFVAGDIFPMQSAIELLAFGLKLDQMFVKLRGIDRDSALLGSEFS